MSTSITATVNNTTVPGPWVLGLGGAGGDCGQSVAIDSSGNTVAAGFFQGTVNFGSGALTSAGGYDMFIAKYSSAGVCLWSRRFGGAGDEIVKRVALDGSGNIVVVGKFSGTSDFGGRVLTSAGGPELFIAKASLFGA